jgi:hypothetical protein
LVLGILRQFKVRIACSSLTVLPVSFVERNPYRGLQAFFTVKNLIVGMGNYVLILVLTSNHSNNPHSILVTMPQSCFKLHEQMDDNEEF